MRQSCSIWVHLIWAITAILCSAIIIGSVAWIFSPTDWRVIIRIEADDNTEKIFEKAMIQQLQPIQSANKIVPNSVRAICGSPGVCVQNQKLDGCEKQSDGVNWCCKTTNTCTLIGVYND
jgi:hypothetical protein